KGIQAPVLQATQEGLETMKSRPEKSYRCGSFALAQLFSRLEPNNPAWRQIHGASSPDGCFTMSELKEMSRTNGFNTLAARRISGEEILVPSVVHWKLDHYAAITEKKGESFLVVDPTFGGKRWIEADAINTEASGNFLVASTNLPAGWKLLST